MNFDKQQAPATSTATFMTAAQPMPEVNCDLQHKIDNWFAAGRDMLWIPIYEVDGSPESLANAQAMAERFSGPRLVREQTDLLDLPLGIKGWLLPEHLDDTDVICLHAPAGEISFGPLFHRITGEQVTWRYPTEREL